MEEYYCNSVPLAASDRVPRARLHLTAQALNNSFTISLCFLKKEMLYYKYD